MSCRPRALSLISSLVIAVVCGALLVVANASPAAATTVPSSLLAGQSLAAADSSTPGAIRELASPSGHYALSLYSYGDEASMSGVTTQIRLEQRETVVSPYVWWGYWTKSHGGPQTVLTLQTDGNLVLYAQPGHALWSTRTAGTGSGNHLDVQDDGNLVLRTRDNRVVWSSGSHTVALMQGQTLGSGQYLKSVVTPHELATTVAMQTDGNLVISEGSVAVWASNTTVPGASVTMQTDGNLVIRSGGRVLWTSRTAGIAGGPDDGAVYLTADHDLRADAQIITGPGRLGGPSMTTRWDTIDRPGEAGLVGAPPERRILTSPPEYNGIGSVLRTGQYLVSANGYRLTMQGDGNLVERTPAGVAVWSTGTGGHPGGQLSVQGDGNLVVRVGGRAVWNAGATTADYAELTMNVTIGTDGNVVARAHGGGVSWSTGPARH